MSYRDNTRGPMVPSRRRDIMSGEVDRLMLVASEAHYQAGLNNESISRSVFRAAYEGSGDVMKGIAAAMLSIGDKHGPLYEARGLIALFHHDPSSAFQLIDESLEKGVMIPGFGNSFFRNSTDPAFIPAIKLYGEIYGAVYGTKQGHDAITKLWMHFCSKKFGRQLELGDQGVYPNAALITGAICHLCQAVPYFENWVFITGRTRAWIESLSLPEAPREEPKKPVHPFKKGAIVEYAGANYEVVGNKLIAGGTMIVGIYDEPPGKHIDWIQADSLKLVKEAP